MNKTYADYFQRKLGDIAEVSAAERRAAWAARHAGVAGELLLLHVEEGTLEACRCTLDAGESLARFHTVEPEAAHGLGALLTEETLGRRGREWAALFPQGEEVRFDPYLERYLEPEGLLPALRQALGAFPTGGNITAALSGRWSQCRPLLWVLQERYRRVVALPQDADLEPIPEIDNLREELLWLPLERATLEARSPYGMAWGAMLDEAVLGPDAWVAGSPVRLLRVADVRDGYGNRFLRWRSERGATEKTICVEQSKM